MSLYIGLVAGGIGTPAAAAAFIMRADFILMGSINYCTVEAYAHPTIKDILQKIDIQDTTYAPAGDMFELGAKVQVLKKRILFPIRANKLYQIYLQYNSLDEIPSNISKQVQKNYFKKGFYEVWEETKKYLIQKGQLNQIKKAENNSTIKMALVFHWSFGYSLKVIASGDLSYKVDFQIQVGASLVAFNQWVKGTELENWRQRYVNKIGHKLMKETAVLIQNKINEFNNL